MDITTSYAEHCAANPMAKPTRHYVLTGIGFFIALAATYYAYTALAAKVSAGVSLPSGQSLQAATIAQQPPVIVRSYEVVGGKPITSDSLELTVYVGFDTFRRVVVKLPIEKTGDVTAGIGFVAEWLQSDKLTLQTGELKDATGRRLGEVVNGRGESLSSAVVAAGYATAQAATSD